MVTMTLAEARRLAECVSAPRKTTRFSLSAVETLAHLPAWMRREIEAVDRQIRERERLWSK